MLNIAIDGPCGAGKSTISKLVAEKLGITYLDTGAMYRAVALFMNEHNIGVDEEEKVANMLNEINISYGQQNSKIIFLNGKDVSLDIRQHAISKLASDFSKIPAVRKYLVKIQREIALTNNVVLDGRDITSYVLPDAKFKFYLTADINERARRRHDELVENGAKITFEKVLADIADRDKNDMNRAFAPLVQTKDSILVDSTKMTAEQVVNFIVNIVNNSL